MLDEALTTFEGMKAAGYSPNSVTLGLLLSACKRAKNRRKALQLFDELTAQGVIVWLMDPCSPWLADKLVADCMVAEPSETLHICRTDGALCEVLAPNVTRQDRTL